MDIKLTKADKIILKNISHNSRILEKELAKKCNLSKDSIRYRIKRMESLGIISGYGVFIDYTPLGYESYKLYLKLNATTKHKDELINFLRSQKHVFSVFESNGNWDIGTAIFAKNRNEYVEIENKLLSKFGSIISSRKFCLMNNAVIFENKLFGGANIRQFEVWNGQNRELIDKIDVEILNILNKNSKESLVNIGAKIKLSADSVSKRIKKLESKKIISFYPSNINYRFLGYEKYKLFVYVKDYSTEVEKKIFDYFKEVPNTLNIIRTIGPWKLEIEFLISTHDDFQKILSVFQENFSKYVLKIDFSIFRNDALFPSEKLLI